MKVQKWSTCCLSLLATKNGLPKWTAQMILVRFFVTKMDLHLNSWYQKILHFKGSGRSQDPKPFWIFWEVFVEVQKLPFLSFFGRIIIFGTCPLLESCSLKIVKESSECCPTNHMISQNQLLDCWIKIRTFHLQGGWSGVKWYHLPTWMGGSGSGSTLLPTKPKPFKTVSIMKKQDQLALIHVRCCKNKSLESWTHRWRLIWDCYDFLCFCLGGGGVGNQECILSECGTLRNPKPWGKQELGQQYFRSLLYMWSVGSISLRSWKSARFQNGKGQLDTQCQWRGVGGNIIEVSISMQGFICNLHLGHAEGRFNEELEAITTTNNNNTSNNNNNSDIEIDDYISTG